MAVYTAGGTHSSPSTPARTRTSDPPLWRRVLFQLSYLGLDLVNSSGFRMAPSYLVHHEISLAAQGSNLEPPE